MGLGDLSWPRCDGRREGEEGPGPQGPLLASLREEGRGGGSWASGASLGLVSVSLHGARASGPSRGLEYSPPLFSSPFLRQRGLESSQH